MVYLYIVDDKVDYAFDKDWAKENLGYGEPDMEITDEEHELYQGQYRLENGKIVLGPTQESINVQMAEEVRSIRDMYLKDTDKYLLSDFPLKEAEKKRIIAYRDYLRNIPQDKQFPDITVKTLEEF